MQSTAGVFQPVHLPRKGIVLSKESDLHVMTDLVLFPGSDLHVALHGAPNLSLRVATRDLDNGKMKYNLTDVTTGCTFDLLAPYNSPFG